MHLVDDIHPAPDLGRGVNGVVPQLPYMIHSIIGCGVNFQHIHTAAGVDAPAGGADVAGISIVWVQAVDGFGQNFRAAGFARTPGTGEEVGVAQPSGLELGLQAFCDAPLSYDFIEGLGPVFPIQGLIHGYSLLILVNGQKKPAHNKIAHPHLNKHNTRYQRSQLGNGNLTAHGRIRLMLLGSPPDMVHGNPLRETGSSTPLTQARRYCNLPGYGNSSLL